MFVSIIDQSVSLIDLLPINHTSYFSKKSINPENDGHERRTCKIQNRMSVKLSRCSIFKHLAKNKGMQRAMASIVPSFAHAKPWHVAAKRF
jgi:hypothetical protein